MENEMEEKDFGLFNALFGKKPKEGLKDSILSVLDNLAKEEAFDLHNPPFINQYSDHQAWQKAVSHLHPAKEYQNIHTETVYKDPQRTVFITWVKNHIPEEKHEHLRECFLILEGSCNFLTPESKQSYQTGDFVDIPDSSHSVEVTSSVPLKVVVQRLKLAS